jgi:RNA polymerase sigma-B factor
VAQGDARSMAGSAHADPAAWAGGSGSEVSAARSARCDGSFSRSDSDRRCWELRLADARRSGDPRERAALIEEYLPLARSLAWRLRTSRDSPDDLVQVACLGLVKAVDRFDPERGQRFSSFAVPTITGELRRYLRDRTWRLHIPRSLQDLIVALGPVTEALTGELQRSPTVDELAKRMRVSPEAILDARQAGDSQFGRSLDEPARQEGRESLAETLGREDRELARADRVIVLEGWLAELPEREREILRLRFEEDLTQSEIAEQFAISQVHVSRLLRKSLEHLQAMAVQAEERSTLEPDQGQGQPQGDEDRQVRPQGSGPRPADHDLTASGGCSLIPLATGHRDSAGNRHLVRGDALEEASTGDVMGST